MALKIPEQDRIYNVSPLPEGFNPDDPTQINADWIMNMLDKIVNGNYPIKSFHTYPTYANMLAEINTEKGQTAYVLETGYEGTFFIYNGTTWTEVSGGDGLDYTDLTNKPSINGIILSGNKTLEDLGINTKSALQVTCSYNNDVLKGVAVVVDETTITTKSNGLATFTGLDSGTKSIVASKDGYATNISSKTIENSFETADVEMNPITLTFNVKNAADVPINGATVNLDKKVVTTDTTHSGTLYNAYTPENGNNVYTTDAPIKLYQSEEQLPNLTEDGTIGGNNCACTASHEDNPAWWAFDGDITTSERCWYSGNVGSTGTCWITYYTPIEVKLLSVFIMNEIASPANFKNAIIQGSNDNNTWDDLYNITDWPNTTGYGETININSQNNYKYFRFYFTSNYGIGVSIQEINIFAGIGEPSTLYSYDNIALAPLNPQPEFTVQTPHVINASMVGTLTNNDGIYRSFSQNNYLQINTLTPTTDFDFIIKCNTGSSYGDLLRTQPDGSGILLRCSGSSVQCYISSTGSGWNVLSGFNTGIIMTANTDMYIKISWHNNTYTFYQSSDGTNWTERNSSSSGLSSPYWNNNTQTIGGCSSYSEAWSGSVNMKETYLDIDGNRTDFWDSKDGITIDNVFYDKTPTNNLVEYISETITTTTNSQGIAVISVITDGKYDYSVLKQLYETMYGQIIINRANETEPVMMYTAPINCYAVEAVTVDSAVKVNAGVGDSNADYDVYAANTATTNVLTLDGLARSSASVGEIAEVRVTDYKEQTITIETDQDNADIQFNNNNDICTVNIVANMKETHNYLAFKRTDNAIIYFKDRTYPFVPSDNNVNETSFTYYTYSGGVMTEHTATTQSSSSGNSTYDGTTLTIHSVTLAVDGVWIRDTAEDVNSYITEYDGATITTSGYLTTPNPVIPTTNYWKFAIEKSSDWDLMLVVGGAFTNLANLQEIVVPNNTVVDIYATKAGQTPTIFTSTYTNRLTITNDRIYRKVNFVLQVTNEGGANTTLTVNGISFTNTGSQQTLDVYAGETVYYTVEKDGYVTQTGNYTIADYPTEKVHQQSITLVANSVVLTVTDGTNALSDATVEIGGDTYTTDANGKVTLSTVNNGVYNYTASMTGYPTATGSYEVAGANVSKTIILAEGEVTFTVTESSSNPLENVLISFNSSSYTTDSNGQVTISNVDYGTYNYTAFLNGYAKKTGDTVNVNAATITKTITLVANYNN